MHVQANCSCTIPAQPSPLIFTNALGFYKIIFSFSSHCWKRVENLWPGHVDDTLKFIFPCDLFGLEHNLLEWKINAWLNLQQIFCDTKVYYWVGFLDLFSKISFRKAWHCDSVIFFLSHRACERIVLLLSVALVFPDILLLVSLGKQG